jgi:hypothetical protein
MKTSRFLQRIIDHEKAVSIILVVIISFITYAPLLSQLGFYGDDWHLLWSVEGRGVKSIIPLFSIDRPFMGLVNYLDYLILGNNVIMWQWYALIWRVLLGLGVLWLLRILWPHQRQMTTLVALLVVVYPGFLTQPNGMNYKNYIFEFAAAIYSMVFMVLALRAKTTGKKVLFWIISVALALLYVLLYEFMIGLEGLRLAILLYLYWPKQRSDKGKTLKEVFRIYLPYLAVLGSFVVWRFFLFESERASTSETALLENIFSSPYQSGLRVGIELFKDLFETIFFSWGVPAYKLMANARYGVFGPAFLWGALAVLLVFGYISSVPMHKKNRKEISSVFVWIGLVSVVTALATIVIPGRDVHFDGFDRYSLHASLGVALIMGGIIYSLRGNFRTVLILLLVWVSVSTHYHNAAQWGETWSAHKDTWWQLVWRAPGLEEDTVLIAQQPPGSGFRQDYEIWGPVNMIYAPQTSPPAIQAQVLTKETAYFIQRGIEKPDHLRDVDFIRDYDHVLILSRATPQSCLQTVDGEQPFLSQFANPLVDMVAKFSNIGQIITEGKPKQPAVDIFGEEPHHTWCYYYQKASLARQRGDWEEIVRLGDRAQEEDYKPRDLVEWMPFFEAYVIFGREKDAKWLSTILKSEKNLRFALCRDLEEAVVFPESYDYDGITSLLCD